MNTRDSVSATISAGRRWLLATAIIAVSIAVTASHLNRKIKAVPVAKRDPGAGEIRCPECNDVGVVELGAEVYDSQPDQDREGCFSSGDRAKTIYWVQPETSACGCDTMPENELIHCKVCSYVIIVHRIPPPVMDEALIEKR